MERREWGPREWSPRKRPVMVEGYTPGDYYFLKFLREVKNRKDFPKNGDFIVNLELAEKLGDPVELYDVINVYHRAYKHSVAQLLWFPSYGRGGIARLKDVDAKWTDANDPVEVLEHWVQGEMTG